MTYKNIFDAYTALTNVAKLNTFTAKESLGIAKLINTLQEDAALIVQERDKLLAKYGTPDPEKAGSYNMHDPEGFNRELSEMLSADAGDVCFTPVKIRDSVIGITPQELIHLVGFIEVEE